MIFENAEQAQTAIMEFTRKVLEAQNECGIAEEVIIVIRADVQGHSGVLFYGSGNPEQWYGMLQQACARAQEIDAALHQEGDASATFSAEVIEQLKQDAAASEERSGE